MDNLTRTENEAMSFSNSFLSIILTSIATALTLSLIYTVMIRQCGLWLLTCKVDVVQSICHRGTQK